MKVGKHKLRQWLFALFMGAVNQLCSGDVFVIAPTPTGPTEETFFPFFLQQIQLTSMRYQQVYNASVFSNVPPECIYATTLTFFQGFTQQGSTVLTVTNMQINLSTTQRTANNLSTNFAENVGPDDTVVFGPGSHKFDGIVTGHRFPVLLDRPFRYNPAAGNLLLDVRIINGAGPVAPNFPRLEAFNAATDESSRMWATNDTATFATESDTTALDTVIQFSAIPSLRIYTSTFGTPTNYFAIEWPNQPSVFRLQQSRRLGSGAIWQTVTNATAPRYFFLSNRPGRPRFTGWSGSPASQFRSQDSRQHRYFEQPNRNLPKPMSLLDALLLDPARINIWVAKRTDEIAGSGTQNDPYDGSTLAKFDALMNGFGVNTCVHVGPGLFETAGYADGLAGGWQPKPGMRILGSGIDVTTLKLVNSSATTQRVYAIGHAYTLVTGISAFGSLRSNFSGWVGFQFQVGGKPVTVSELGRWIVSGNSGSHAVKLFNADGTAVPGGAVTLNTSGQTAGQFAYVTLTTPVTLAANTTYALMSQEVNTGDQWYDYPGTQITVSGIVGSAAAAWANNDPPPINAPSSPDNKSYGPVNLLFKVDFFEVSDLTIDCNLGGVSGTSSTAGAVRVMGNHSRVVRVKAKNWGNKSTGTGGFVIAMLTGDPSIGVNGVINCGIEECLALSPNTSAAGPVTVLHVGGKETASTSEEAFGLGPYIRNCFVDCDQTTDFTKDYRGLSMAWCKGGVVEGNQVHNTKYGGPYQTATGARDLVVRNNVYRNAYKGPYWSMGAQGVQRLVVEGNSIELTTHSGAASTDYAIEIHSSASPPTYVHGNLVIRDNRIRYVDGGSGNGNGIRVVNARNLLVRENVVEVSPSNPLSNKNCESVEYFENRTPAGALIRGYNDTGSSSTAFSYNELETEAEEAFILGFIRKR